MPRLVLRLQTLLADEISMSDFQVEREEYPSDDYLGRAAPSLYDWQKGEAEHDEDENPAPTSDQQWPGDTRVGQY